MTKTALKRIFKNRSPTETDMVITFTKYGAVVILDQRRYEDRRYEDKIDGNTVDDLLKSVQDFRKQNTEREPCTSK